MSVNTDCASAIASSAQTVTSTSSASVPISLRVRMDMRRRAFLPCVAATSLALYGPRRLEQAIDGRRMGFKLAGPDVRHHAIRMWLLTVAALVLATLVIGGATRL